MGIVCGLTKNCGKNGTREQLQQEVQLEEIQISTEENIAYSQISPQISTEENMAYGQISTEENVACNQSENEYYYSIIN